MGCQIATSIALRVPERLAALGLLAGGGRFVGLVYKSAGHALLERLVADPTEAGMRALIECVNGRLDDIDAELAERMRWATDPHHLAAQRRLQQGRQQPDSGPDYTGVGRLPMPIALGWGELERFNPFEIGPQIAARLPQGARYHLFRGAGHNIPHDRPEETARFIIELVKAGFAPTKPAEKTEAS
jgi:pimeloyl-ACP methyl ester carboxylesterase